MKAIQADFRERDFALVGISLDEDGWELAELMEKEGMGWTQVCDLRGFEGTVPNLYRVRGIPHTVLLDREGRIVRTGLRGEDLRAAIRELVGTAR